MNARRFFFFLALVAMSLILAGFSFVLRGSGQVDEQGPAPIPVHAPEPPALPTTEAVPQKEATPAAKAVGGSTSVIGVPPQLPLRTTLVAGEVLEVVMLDYNRVTGLITFQKEDGEVIYVYQALIRHQGRTLPLESYNFETWDSAIGEPGILFLEEPKYGTSCFLTGSPVPERIVYPEQGELTSPFQGELIRTCFFKAVHTGDSFHLFNEIADSDFRYISQNGMPLAGNSHIENGTLHVTNEPLALLIDVEQAQSMAEKIFKALWETKQGHETLLLEVFGYQPNGDWYKNLEGRSVSSCSLIYQAWRPLELSHESLAEICGYGDLFDLEPRAGS